MPKTRTIHALRRRPLVGRDDRTDNCEICGMYHPEAVCPYVRTARVLPNGTKEYEFISKEEVDKLHNIKELAEHLEFAFDLLEKVISNLYNVRQSLDQANYYLSGADKSNKYVYTYVENLHSLIQNRHLEINTRKSRLNFIRNSM